MGITPFSPHKRVSTYHGIRHALCRSGSPYHKTIKRPEARYRGDAHEIESGYTALKVGIEYRRIPIGPYARNERRAEHGQIPYIHTVARRQQNVIGFDPAILRELEHNAIIALPDLLRRLPLMQCHLAQNARLQPGRTGRSVAQAPLQQIVLQRTRQLLEGVGHMLQSPVEPARSDARVGMPETPQQRAMVHVFLNQPANSAARHNIHPRATLMQQRRGFQRALPATNHHHALASEMLKRAMLGRVRDQFGGKLIVLGRTVHIIAQTGRHHHHTAPHQAAISQSKREVVLLALDAVYIGLIDIGNRLPLEPESIEVSIGRGYSAGWPWRWKYCPRLY